MNEKILIRYPHGYFAGGVWNNDYSPSITISSFQHNNIVIENMEKKDFDRLTREQQKLMFPPELQEKKFRIRKLTPRECFRLMGVDDSDIDKIQASGISNSGQYKLAGNSMVVDVLFHLFRKMFIETDADIEPGEQMSLF